MEFISEPKSRDIQRTRIVYASGDVETVRAAWCGFELDWAWGHGASQDFSTPRYGLNITFLGQEASRSRVGEGGTIERPLAPADVTLNLGDPLVWVENHAPFEGLNIGLSPGALERFGAMNGLVVPELRPALFENDARLRHIARIITDELRTGTGGPLFREALMNLLLAHLIQRYGVSPGPAERGRLSGEQLRVVLDHVDDRLASTLSLDELAKLAGMSTFHFARQFKRATGLPPHRYVTLRRIKRAQMLLADRKLSIAQIAFAVGYSNARHFSDQFRRAVGRTPAMFRAERA